MKGMLAPKFREVALGRVEVRGRVQDFQCGHHCRAATCSDGKVSRAGRKFAWCATASSSPRTRSTPSRRFKDDVKEVAQGYECGIGLDKFNDIKEGDIFEAFTMEEYRDWSAGKEAGMPQSKNIARLSEDMKRELIAIIGQMKDPRG